MTRGLHGQLTPIRHSDTKLELNKIEQRLSSVYIHECTYMFTFARTCVCARVHTHTHTHTRFSRIVNTNRTFTDTNPGIKNNPIKTIFTLKTKTET